MKDLPKNILNLASGGGRVSRDDDMQSISGFSGISGSTAITSMTRRSSVAAPQIKPLSKNKVLEIIKEESVSGAKRNSKRSDKLETKIGGLKNKKANMAQKSAFDNSI